MSDRSATSSAPKVEDPVIAQAMRVWDSLTPGEQRAVFRTTAEAVTTYSRTSDIDPLVTFAKSITGMVCFESQPGFQGSRRGRPTEPPGRDEGEDLNEVIKRLRG